MSERHASERVVQSGYLRGQQAATYQYRCVSAPIPTVGANAQLDEAWAGLCPAQHAISMSRGPPTIPTTAAPRRAAGSHLVVQWSEQS